MTYAAGGSVTIHWLGHACFRLDWLKAPGSRLTVLLDPFPPDMGYPAVDAPAHVVLSSHPHFDHAAVPGGLAALVVRGVTDDQQDWRPVRLNHRGMTLSGLATYHDQALGSQRGKNMAFCLDFGGFRVAHLGDLGHPLGKRQIAELAGTDVLFVPTGGHFTIDAAQARDLVAAVKPRVAIPMHYRTARIEKWPLAPVEEFLGDSSWRRLQGPVTVTTEDLPGQEIWVFDCP